MTDSREAGQRHAKKRLAMILAGGFAGVVLGLAGVYGIGRLTGNVAVAPECQAAVETARRIAPLVRGEVAALAVASRPKRLPELAFQNEPGARKTLADWRGRTVLFNLWATWCVPCRKEMPALDALQGKLGGANFEVVAVNIDTRDAEKPKAWLKEVGIARLGYFADPTAKVFQDLKEAGKAFGMPTTQRGCAEADRRGAQDLRSNRNIEVAAKARRDVGETVHVLLRRFEQFHRIARRVRIHAQHLGRDGHLHLAGLGGDEGGGDRGDVHARYSLYGALSTMRWSKRSGR
jgi:thiol-disulfide isomerase/thioredoxin